jgi:hypothetical protein
MTKSLGYVLEMARLRSSFFVLRTSYLGLICVDGAELCGGKKGLGSLECGRAVWLQGSAQSSAQEV